MFIELFSAVSKEKINYYTTTIAKTITITIGFGENDIISQLHDIVEGRFKLISSGDLSSGFILNAKKIGVYIEHIFDGINGLWGVLGFDLTVDHINFPDLKTFPELVPSFDSDFLVTNQAYGYAILLWILWLAIKAAEYAFV